MKLRKRFLKQLKDVFSLADEMCCSFHPDNIDDVREEIHALRKETFKYLRNLNAKR